MPQDSSSVRGDFDAPRKLPRPWRPTAVAEVKDAQEAMYEGAFGMIILGEMPLNTVEQWGFGNLMSVLNPHYVVPSEATIKQDCLKRYLNEKILIKSYLEKLKPRMSLGINTWVSEEGIAYLCLSGHFVDENWEMNRLVLNVFQCPVDEVEEATKCVEEFCLTDWGINQVFALTINYKPLKSAFVKCLGGRFVSRNEVLLGGKYLHLRCLTTIINHVAWDELNREAELVDCVREIVRFFWLQVDRNKIEKLKELAAEENVKSKRFPFMDSHEDRWFSVCIMLESAMAYENVYEKFAASDVHFQRAFSRGGTEGLRMPTRSDWRVVKALSKVLRELYVLRCRVSGSNYYWSNASAFFGVLRDISGFLNEWVADDDNALASIAFRIKSRYETYMGSPEKVNALLYAVVVLDPRYKLDYVLSTIKDIFEGKTGENVCEMAKKALFDLFEEYKKLYAENDESELDMYLRENVEIVDTEDFDVLKWWKTNCPRFPVLARMARDLFAMPISTVSFESAFTSGGVLSADDHRYNYKYREEEPDMMQPLVCCSDWFRDEPRTDLYEDYEQEYSDDESEMTEYEDYEQEDSDDESEMTEPLSEDYEKDDSDEESDVMESL